MTPEERFDAWWRTTEIPPPKYDACYNSYLAGYAAAREEAKELADAAKEARMIDATELRRLLAEATPLPWKAGTGPYAWDDGIIADAGVTVITNSGRGATDITGEDAALIVAAVNGLPAMLDTLDNQRDNHCHLVSQLAEHVLTIENLRGALRKIRDTNIEPGFVDSKMQIVAIQKIASEALGGER